jgi:hypothetical protein
MPTPFDLLFDEVDTLNEFLAEGPEGSDADFLKAIKQAILDVAAAAERLTIEDVATEFVDDEEEAIETELV